MQITYTMKSCVRVAAQIHENIAIYIAPDMNLSRENVS